jgi:formamidase
VKCDACGNAVKPFEIVHGYTVTFDETRAVGLTLPQGAAETIARDADHYAALPDGAASIPS